MKWIGQHIYDLVSRFRSDVYLENIQSGTIASGGNLGLDSNNKIVKATEATGDITGVALTAGTGIDLTSVANATGGDYAATIGVDVSDFMTNGSNDRIVTATGTDGMNAEANLQFSGTSLTLAGGLQLNQPEDLGAAAIAIDHTDTDQNALQVSAACIDADAVYISATGLTSVASKAAIFVDAANSIHPIHVDQDVTQTTNFTMNGGLFSNVTKGVNTASGQLTSIIGTRNTVSDAGTNVGLAYVYGLYNSANMTNANGTTGCYGIYNVVTGAADDTFGIYQNCVNGSPDIRLVSSADQNDYCEIATTANGATTISTRDNGATEAHFEIAADGDIILDSAGQIKLEPVAGNNILLDGTVTVDGGSVTGITTLGVDSVSLTAVQTSSESFVDNDTSIMTSAAIADKIEAYGYSTTTGDITGVVVTADDSNTVSDTAGSADFGIKGGPGIDTTVDGTDIVVAGETASTTNSGIVELATTGEADTGTDTARAVTPAGLKSHVDARHTYVYFHIHGRSSTSNDNWFFQDGTNDGEFNWETDGSADAFAALSDYITVDSSTIDLGRDIGVMGFVVPYDCTLIGFKAIGRDLSGNDEFKAGLWSSPVFSGYGGSTGTTEFTLRAIATASSSGGSGGSFNGICKLDDLSRSYSLSAGQILLPSLAETDTSRTYLSMTIVLKVPII